MIKFSTALKICVFCVVNSIVARLFGAGAYDGAIFFCVGHLRLESIEKRVIELVQP